MGCYFGKGSISDGSGKKLNEKRYKQTSESEGYSQKQEGGAKPSGAVTTRPSNWPLSNEKCDEQTSETIGYLQEQGGAVKASGPVLTGEPSLAQTGQPLTSTTKLHLPNGNGEKSNGKLDKVTSETNGYDQMQEAGANTTGKGPNLRPQCQTIPLLPDAKLEDLRSHYSIEKLLVRGQFGITYICRKKSTNHQYVYRSIWKWKRKLQNSRIRDIKREVEIMKLLMGHEHVVEFKEAYEDNQWVHLVMELCTGGELLDWIITKTHYSERTAAEIWRAVVNVVNVYHTKGVMHRDLKPENFLFSCKEEWAVVKAIDFGCSVFIQGGKTYKDVVGSVYYIAPEVLRNGYGKEIDIWSAGVILYIFLSGVPPFCAETEDGNFKAILKGHFDLDSAPWPSILNSAKDLVRKMLTQDPRKRITSANVLKHPWITEVGDASDKLIDNTVISRMKKFRAMNTFKKLAVKVVARNFSVKEIEGLKEKFTNMDKDKSGIITCAQLKEGLSLPMFSFTEPEFKKLMSIDDVDANGTIDYIEFISATMNRQKQEGWCLFTRSFLSILQDMRVGDSFISGE